MGLLDAFGGGEGKAAKKKFKAIAAGIEEAKTYQKPFYDAGTRGLNRYEAFYNTMADPRAYYENQMDHYKESPVFTNRLRKMTDVLNNNAARMGRLGLWKNNTELADYTHDALLEDQQDYINNIYGIGREYGGAQLNLTNLGANAGDNLGNLAMSYGQAKGDADAAQEMAKSQAWQNALAFAGNTAANIYTGGMSGAWQAAAKGGASAGLMPKPGQFSWGNAFRSALNPYTSNYMRDAQIDAERASWARRG